MGSKIHRVSEGLAHTDVVVASFAVDSFENVVTGVLLNITWPTSEEKNLDSSNEREELG